MGYTISVTTCKNSGKASMKIHILNNSDVAWQWCQFPERSTIIVFSFQLDRWLPSCFPHSQLWPLMANFNICKVASLQLSGCGLWGECTPHSASVLSSSSCPDMTGRSCLSQVPAVAWILTFTEHSSQGLGPCFCRTGVQPAKLNEKQMDMHLIKDNAKFVSVTVDKWVQCLTR